MMLMTDGCVSCSWSMDIEELERSAAKAKADGCTLKALAVINPGNPTGQCLDDANMREVVRFCEKHGLVLMAVRYPSPRLHRCSCFGLGGGYALQRSPSVPWHAALLFDFACDDRGVPLS